MVVEVVVGSLLVVAGVALAVLLRPAAGALLAAAGAVIVLVGGGAVVGVVDEPVLEQAVAARTTSWTAVAEALSLWGGTVGTGGLAVLVAAVLAWRGRTRVAVVWVAAVAAGATTIRGLKVTLDRPRPSAVTALAEETTESLPSGHALMAALGLGLAAAGVGLLVRDTRARLLAPAAAALAVVLAAAIGVSRIYLGVHWTTDVVAGWLIGAAWATAAVTVATGRASRRTGDTA